MEKSLKSERIFQIFSLFCFSVGILGTLLAASGYFFGSLFWFLVAGGFIFSVAYLRKNFKRVKQGISKQLFLVITISLLLVILFSFFVEPSVFSGRDQGSLSEAAIRLSKDHQLSFSFPASEEFEKIYGPGRALNFPGFVYGGDGSLSTQFPVGFISWLAIFFSIFGLKGLIAANAVSLFIFLVSVYLVAREVSERKDSPLIVFLLAASSFVFLWFFKFTLSENLALSLVWFGIWQFLVFQKSRRSYDLELALLPFVFLLFVRIEAVAFLAIIFAIIFWESRKDKKRKKAAFKKLAFVGGFFILSIIAQWQFYLEMVKNILKPFLSSGSGSAGSFWSEPLLSLQVLSAYAILDFIILGLAGALWLIKRRDFQKAIPFLILLPSFVYLIDPNISNDHPWMLRRFAFTIIPVSILYTVLFVSKFLRRKIYLYVFSAILLVTNLMVSLPYLFFIPDRGLIGETRRLAENFKEDDLVLVDRGASGDPFSMISGPLNFLFGRQAVYFFNPSDLQKISQERFSDIYLIIPDENIGKYMESEIGGRLEKIKDYSLRTDYLDVFVPEEIDPRNRVVLPRKERQTVRGGIYLFIKK